MAIEIVSLPIENGNVPQLCKRLPEGMDLHPTKMENHGFDPSTYINWWMFHCNVELPEAAPISIGDLF